MGRTIVQCHLPLLPLWLLPPSLRSCGGGSGADRGRSRRPGPLGQGGHTWRARGGGQAPAKHAAPAPGGAGSRAGRLVGRPGPDPLPRCCLTEQRPVSWTDVVPTWSCRCCRLCWLIGSFGVWWLCRWMSQELLERSTKPATAWPSSSTVSCSWTHRHCSVRVRIQGSAQPLVSGSPRNAGSSLMPSQAREPGKWAERYWGPQSCRGARPRATSASRRPSGR
jgi:hypothetical protein